MDEFFDIVGTDIKGYHECFTCPHYIVDDSSKLPVIFCNGCNQRTLYCHCHPCHLFKIDNEWHTKCKYPNCESYNNGI